MTTRTVRWGTLLLVLAALVVAAVATASVAIGDTPSEVALNLVLPSVVVALSILVLFAGHVSYPRVHNLRVYLAGFLVGSQGLLYALLNGFDRFVTVLPAAPAGIAEAMFALAIVGAYLYSLLPAFPTYRATRTTTWIFVILQAAFLVIVRLLPGSFGWLAVLVPASVVSVQVVVIATVTVGIIVINALLPSQSFFLRGSFAGLALMAGSAWLLPIFFREFGPVVSPAMVHVLYAGAAPLFLSVSILFHVLAKMDHRVSYDPLLQVYNRDFANQILAEQSSVQTRPPFAVMMIDIDHFKLVNDTHGHQAGDRMLFTIAQVVQKSVVPDGIVCRYGGEELIVFFPGKMGRDIVALAKRLLETVENTETVWKRQRIAVTVSIGISDRRFARHPLSHIVHAADKALYIAKDNGRNQVRFVRLRDPRKVDRR